MVHARSDRWLEGAASNSIAWYRTQRRWRALLLHPAGFWPLAGSCRLQPVPEAIPIKSDSSSCSSRLMTSFSTT